MKRIGAAVPVAWPKDGADREKGSGEPLKLLYKQQGLLMLPEHATWPDGSVSTEAGILEWDEREQTGRLKVARTCRLARGAAVLPPQGRADREDQGRPDVGDAQKAVDAIAAPPQQAAPEAVKSRKNSRKRAAA
jgi:hypothetical protein